MVPINAKATATISSPTPISTVVAMPKIIPSIVLSRPVGSISPAFIADRSFCPITQAGMLRPKLASGKKAKKATEVRYRAAYQRHDQAGQPQRQHVVATMWPQADVLSFKNAAICRRNPFTLFRLHRANRRNGLGMNEGVVRRFV